MNALELEHVTVTLGERVVLHDVTVAFAQGDVHAVVGRSGAGKSVLMKAAAKLLPSTGVIRVGAPPLVFVHQDPALLDTLDVEENVRFAVERMRLHRSAVAARVDGALSALGIGDLGRRAPASLSVAQQKRVSLARALCLQPGVLVVDEPTTGLDPIAARQVDDALASLPSSGTTLIVITHSPRTLARLDPRVVVVDGGGVHERPRAAA